MELLHDNELLGSMEQHDAWPRIDGARDELSLSHEPSVMREGSRTISRSIGETAASP